MSEPSYALLHWSSDKSSCEWICGLRSNLSSSAQGVYAKRKNWIHHRVTLVRCGLPQIHYQNERALLADNHEEYVTNFSNGRQHLMTTIASLLAKLSMIDVSARSKSLTTGTVTMMMDDYISVNNSRPDVVEGFEVIDNDDMFPQHFTPQASSSRTSSNTSGSGVVCKSLVSGKIFG